MMEKPKLIVTGYARHGKDTVCEILKSNHGFSFESSSHILAEELIYPSLKDIYGYTSLEECYEDRVNHRKEWFDLIVQYNNPDLTRLGRLIFSKYDIYCGLRNRKELDAIKKAGLFTQLVWVDSFQRLHTLEDSSSMTITMFEADTVISNNGTLKDLEESVNNFVLNLTNKYGE